MDKHYLKWRRSELVSRKNVWMYEELDKQQTAVRSTKKLSIKQMGA